jgi:hypothetical protein
MPTAPALSLAQPAFSDLPRGLPVVTRYVGATDCKGSRIIATCKRDGMVAFRAVVSYKSRESHYEAALACLRKIEAHNNYFSFRFQAAAITCDGYIFTTEELPNKAY